MSPSYDHISIYNGVVFMDRNAVPIRVVSNDVDRLEMPGINAGVRVLRHEAAALSDLAEKLDETFEKVLTLIREAPGRVIVTGMGKSGHIARKISATMASTGTPSFFVHPAEASHGDLGMISRRDVVIALSNSGETAELSSIINYTRRFTIPLVAMTGSTNSTLARQADLLLAIPKIPEACRIGLVPTTSTTMMLALGDALAIALLEYRGFSPQDFKVFHPGGQLGQVLQSISDIMRVGNQVPLVTPETTLADAIIEITSKGCGCTGIVEGSRLIGIITDGDLRRHLDAGIRKRRAGEIMSVNPKTIQRNALAAEAIAQMNYYAISSLFVIDKDDAPIGIVHLHDCLKAGAA